MCDRHDMVGDLTHYLFSNNMLRYIEGYVQKVNPSKAPQVVGGLLDAEASDEFINNLILSVRSLIPVEQLCLEVSSFASVSGPKTQMMPLDSWRVRLHGLSCRCGLCFPSPKFLKRNEILKLKTLITHL